MVNSNDEFFNSVVGINNEAEPTQTDNVEQDNQSGVKDILAGVINFTSPAGVMNYIGKNWDALSGSWQRGRGIASTYDERDDVFDIESEQAALQAPDSLYEAYVEASEKNEQIGQGENVEAWMGSLRKNLDDGENWFMSALMATQEHGMIALAEVSLQSIAQGTNKRVVGEAMPATVSGLGVGLAAGGYGALATGPASFMAGTNYAVETVATFDELLKEELKSKNLEFTPDNIRIVMADDESRSRIKRKARQRGATIGMIEGVTQFAGIKGSSAIAKTIDKTKKLSGLPKKIAAASASGTVAATSEVVGGGAGEFFGAKAAGMDATAEDIIVESVAGLGTAPVTATIAAANVALTAPKYTLDGTNISKSALMDYVNGASPQELASMKIEIKNDDATTAEIRDKAVDSIIESQMPTNITNADERAELVKLEKQFRALKGKDTVTAEVEKSKIKRQIKDIVSKYDGTEADAALEKTKKEVQDARLQKNVKFAEESAKEIGRESKVFETTEEALTYAMEQGMSEDQANEVAGADGFFSGNTLVINKEVARETGAISVGSHELFHGIVGDSFNKLNLKEKSKLVKSFGDVMTKSQKSLVEKRILDNYNTTYNDKGEVINDNVYGLDKTKSIFDASNVDKWMGRGDETFTAFSDGIELGQIQFDEGVFSKLKNVIQELLRKVGINKEFQNGRQVYNFLKDYNKSVTKGKLSERQKEFAKKDFDMTEIDAKASYTKTERDNRLDAIGEKSTKAEWDAGGSGQAISDMYMSGDLEAIVRNNLSSDLKNLPNYSEEDFISETIGELMPHIRNFNPLRKEDKNGKKNPVYEYLIKAGVKESDISSLSLGQAKKRLSDYASKETTSEADKININKTIEKYGLSGWIRGQVSNKIGEVLKKKKATTETFTVDTTDEKVKETVESDDDLQDLQEEDLSVAAQAKKKAEVKRREEKGMEEDVEYSTFRRALKVKGKQGLSDNIVDNVKQAVVKTMATERTTPDSDEFIANIKKSFLTELKKPIQDMMGKKDDFTNFLKTNREAIIAALPTSTLVQMERNIDPADRVFTVEVKRNLNPTETKDAIANNLLPKDTNINSGPTLYNKRMPSEGEFLRYFSPPLYVPSKKDPNKSVRSGLKGTRKDTLAEQMGIELAFDATMEVVQSPDVAERRSLVTNTDFIDSGVEELARSIGRGVDVKFSRSNPAEIGFKMDLALDNINTDAYLDIRFSKSSRDAYIKRLVKNRPDLKGKEEQYVDSVFDWLETTDIKKRSKYEKMAMHYMAKGYLILPEDGYKVIEAERLATIKKIDPFSVGNPNDIIEKYAGTVKGARTNPDTVKEFSNKKDLGEGVVTYDVEQTKEGQLAVREVIDTHFGKKSNPWCLAARSDRAAQEYGEFDNREQANIKARELESQGYDVEVSLVDGTYEVYGDLMIEPNSPRALDEAFIPWKNYQRGGKGYQIVFTDGKLSHFKDGSGQYWDRLDDNSDYISKKLSDLKLEDGFTQKRELNVNTGEQVLGDKSRVTGNRQDGTYTETTVKPETTVEIEEVRKNGELTYQKKLTTTNDESYGSETKYYGNSKSITNTESHPNGLKKGGSPRWELETTLDRAGKIAGLDLKLDKYTETSFVNDYKQAPPSPWGGDVRRLYNRLGSKHTVKGELNGKNATVEIFDSVDVNQDTKITKVKVNGKTVYTASKVDDTGIKFSKSKFKITRNGLVATGLGIQYGIIFDPKTKTYKLAPEVVDYIRKNTPKPRKNKTEPKKYYPSSEVLGYFKDFYNDLPTSTQLDLSLQGEAIGTEMGRLSRLISGTTEGHLFEAVIARYGYKTLENVQPGITIISKSQAAKKLGTTPSKLPDIVLWDGKDNWESADSLFTVEAKFDNSRAGGVTITDYKFKDFTPNNAKVLNKYDSLDETGEVINKTWKQDMLKQFSEPLANFVKEAEALGTKIVDSKTKVPIGVHNALIKKGNSFLSKVRAIGEVKSDQIANYYNNGDFKPVKSDVIAHTSKGAFTLGVDPHGLYANGILPKLAGDYQVTMRLKTNVSKNKKFVTYTPILEIEFRSSDIKGEYADGRKVDASDLKLQNKKDFEKVLKNVKGFKLSKSQSTSKAMELGQLTNKDTEAVGMSTFDFDETLIIDGDNFITATKGDDVVKITSSQWPLVGDTYASEGYTFDFSDFVNVRGGVDGPLLQKMKNQISKYGVENVFVLTARPAESATAIQGWLESKGINIPLNNITGLGNSSGDAKAQWMLDKFAEGYNDMYFVDDALPNVKAVKNVLDQLDIKSNVQQAKIKFSKTASQKLNDMIERKKGIDSDEIISSAAAKRRGANVNKFQVFVPPTAEDFSGLLYYFAGKGKQGDADLAFMKEFLLDPLSRGERDIAIKKQSLIRGYNELKDKNWKAAAKIKEMAADTPYTKGTAVRVYLWNQDKTDIPGLSDKEVQELVDIVKNDPELIAYADGLRALVGDSEGKYITPSNDWVVETIAKDLQDATSRVGRKKFLAEFIENADAFFSKDNLNKMEAAYGKDFRESLEDMLYRIKTGQNRPSGTDASTKKWMNWLNNSVGAIMFFNTKSAVLQLMSTVNYLNWSDNNFLLAGKAFANQKQFWSDFSMLWNSDFLKQRRFGLSTDINEAEIANAAAGAKNKATAVLAYLLKKGFLPTQIADSFAISSGGAAFYRNRVNSYVKQGMDQKAAEEKAMTDFREITEENQQSSRPDRISKQQASPLGRVILAFQNTPMQYARIIKKSVADIVAGRGDLKTHVSKIIFYGGVQSLIFGAMQNALFALAFDDEEDDKNLTKTELEKKQKKRDTQYERTLNTMLDSLLNGSGLTGRVISTIKNTIFKFMDEKEKGWNSDMGNVAIEAANISPPLGSKLRKMKKAGDVYDWNQKVIDEMDTFDINNPIWEAGANVIESTTNVPAARAIKKLESIREAFNQNNETWQRIAVIMGWSQWDLGIEGQKRQAVQATKEYLKKKKKDEKAASKKPTTKKSSSEDAYFNKVVNSRKNEASKVQGGKYRCTALTQDLSQCKNRTDNSSRKCFLHN